MAAALAAWLLGACASPPSEGSNGVLERTKFHDMERDPTVAVQPVPGAPHVERLPIGATVNNDATDTVIAELPAGSDPADVLARTVNRMSEQGVRFTRIDCSLQELITASGVKQVKSTWPQVEYWPAAVKLYLDLGRSHHVGSVTAPLLQVELTVGRGELRVPLSASPDPDISCPPTLRLPESG